MSRSKSEISLDSSTYSESYNDNGIEFASTLDHIHYLHLRFVDEENGVLVHDPHRFSFSRYVDEQTAQGNPPLQEYTMTNEKGHPLIYYYVPEDYRSHLKALPLFFHHLHHERDMSSTGFSINNLVILNNILKIWCINFQPSNSQTRMDDLCCIANATMDIFRGFEDKLPLDLHHYVDMLWESDGSEMSSFYLQNHMALMSSKDRLVFYKSAFAKKDCFHRTEDADKYWNALKKLPSQNLWYQHKFASDDKHFGPIIKCRDFGKVKAKYDETSTNGAAALDLLRCSRNLGTHLQQHTRDYIHTVTTDLDMDLMLSSVFSLELAQFQQALSDEGLLQYFI